MSQVASKESMDILLSKKLIVSDGIRSLEEIQQELDSNIAGSKSWGNFAVFLNAILIPLNIILNAFEVKQFDTMYKKMVKVLYTVYEYYGKFDGGPTKILIDEIKKSVVDDLEKKGTQEAAQLIPVVNIFIGLAEDSVALFQIASEVSQASSEQNSLRQKLKRDIEKAKTELRRIESEIGKRNLNKVP